MQLCFFEDKGCQNFEPLIYYRPSYDFICGIFSLRNKILQAYNRPNYSLFCRPYIEDFLEISNPGIPINKIEGDRCLFINGSIIASANISEIIPSEGEDKLFKSGNNIVAARVSGQNLRKVKRNFAGILDEALFEMLSVENIEVKKAEYIWDFIRENPSELRCDFERIKRIRTNKNISGKIFDGAHLLEKDNIIIEDGALIKPGVVIDASSGPIYISKNVIVSSNSVIEGPAYIGENSIVKSFAHIYQNVSVGEVCKIGGEIEDSILHSYTNKQHPGFLGHAYLGEWINIGADTNCSDLKNNYSSIKVYANGKEVDTKMQFLGIIMGDHSKTAINTMFNTGTVVGFSSNIFGAGFPDKHIPSFSWGGREKMITYAPEKSIETAKKMMLRRNKEMSEVEEKLFTEIFELTKSERLKKVYE